MDCRQLVIYMAAVVAHGEMYTQTKTIYQSKRFVQAVRQKFCHLFARVHSVHTAVLFPIQSRCMQSRSAMRARCRIVLQFSALMPVRSQISEFSKPSHS